ncbi:porin [Saccharicrinis fermentans]|uniref:Phosphate-selective porin n=1 Tax=Saccharicrinis fermentans DSM 9555 = JCM 21142 TaxID=869213 RepID=W7YT64_9BACT|nr:hypothetical protein [Saccharicrinis fermentans]GAF05629.1 phosphate-selective porin [Saccharicrinis fermentans DSM 9555 = JCM 21142]
MFWLKYLINKKKRRHASGRTGLMVLVFMAHLCTAGFSKNGASSEDISHLRAWNQWQADKCFRPWVVMEAWATYSINEEQGDRTYANRGDISLRRLRFGGSGSPYSWLRYSLQLSMDRIGEDPFASTKGSYQGVDIWNAYMTAKLSPKHDLLNLHVGYFWAQISREYSTVAWTQGSFDRTRANWYLRKFLTGKGNGIESGMALGGQKNMNGFGFSYRVGTFEPTQSMEAQHPARLYTSHLIFSLGDLEQDSYKYRLRGNDWGKRKGISLGLGASSQAAGMSNDSVCFDSSYAWGMDILFCYSGFRLDGEYFKLKRTAEGYGHFNGKEWHIRFAYNLMLGHEFFEPVLTYDRFEGSGSKSVYNYVGDDHTLDVGVNWYLNKERFKLSVHYLVQEGSVASNTGDYLGLGFQWKL